jgi:hypothetical protein
MNFPNLFITGDKAVLQRSWLAILVAFAFVLPASAQDKATLKWKFEKDMKPFYQKMTTTTTQNMKVMGSDVIQKQEQTFYFSWTIDKVDGDVVKIKQKIIGVKMSIDIGGSKIDYDSMAKEPAGQSNPLGEFFKALLDAEFTLTLNTKDGIKVTDIDGREKFIDNLVKANPQMKGLLEQILSKEALKEMADPTFAAAPGREVVKDKDSWKKETTLSMGPIGTYKNTYEYTYAGRDTAKKAEKITVKTTLTYTPPDEKTAGQGLPFKIKSADLKSSDATGIVFFDTEKGRVASSELSLKLSGKLSIEIGGQTTQVDLSQDQKTTVETMDEDPTKKKP